MVLVAQSFPLPVWLTVHPVGNAGGVTPPNASLNTVISPPATTSPTSWLNVSLQVPFADVKVRVKSTSVPQSTVGPTAMAKCGAMETPVPPLAAMFGKKTEPSVTATPGVTVDSVALTPVAASVPVLIAVTCTTAVSPASSTPSPSPAPPVEQSSATVCPW